MPSFVFEIGTEEMPSRFLPGLENVLREEFTTRLTDAHVDFKGVEVHSTPRRLAVIIPEMAAVQRQSEELVTGPPRKIAYDAEGAPTKAALGFAKTQGVELEQTFMHTTDKGEYLALRKQVGGEKVLNLLPEMLKAVILALPFPKRMRWGSGELTFGRPINWILAMLDAEVVSFDIDQTSSGNQTRGHRVHGPGPWDVPEASAYKALLKDKGRVTLESGNRRQAILEQGDALAAAAIEGGKVVWKDDLLQEVMGLVEHPMPVLGSFDQAFLELPREVLLTSMESHQKSFGVEDAQGRLMAHFLCTLNVEPKDVTLVRKGWERVLKARLEDARFFWKTDLAQSLDQWMGKLEAVIFLGPLGSMADKARRIEKLCAGLAEVIAPDLKAHAQRAGLLAKADLVTEMVGEFADLQGMMGGIYARKFGEADEVAQGIYEHYLPAGPDSPVPASICGALVSLADKADTLAGCFGLGMIPTGANDPYALRRCALGICRIILDKGFRLDLDQLLRSALEGYGEREWKLDKEKCLDALHDFFAQRLKSLFISQGYATLVVEAAVAAGISDVWGLKARLDALQAFSQEEDFEQAVLTFKRAGNIIRKQGQEEPLDGVFRDELLEASEEKELARQITDLVPRFEDLWKQDAYSELMGLLRELRPFVDAFFDNVMVMCEEREPRLNRLNLLKALVDMLSRLADFSALQV